MRDLALPLAAAGLCLGAFGAGTLLADTNAAVPGQRGGRGQAVPLLPDSQRLAKLAAGEFEALPRAIWLEPAKAELLPGAMPFPLAGTAEPAGMPGTVPPGTLAPPARSPSGEEASPADAAAVRAMISQSLSAIIRTNGTYRLVLADRATTLRQNLSVGDSFADGWRVSRIASDGVTLAKGRYRLDVPIAYAPAPRRIVAASRSPALEDSQATDLPGRQDSTPTPRRRVSRRTTAQSQE